MGCLCAAAAMLAALSIATVPAAAMVGGAPPAADGAGRSVVMVLGSYGTACTATAIARDLLLTAAHCVQPGADYKLVGSDAGREPVLKNISRIMRDPQFDLKRLLGHLATADVALLKLAEPLPAKIPPVPLDDGAAGHRRRQLRRCGLRRHRARRRPYRRHRPRGDACRHGTAGNAAKPPVRPPYQRQERRSRRLCGRFRRAGLSRHGGSLVIIGVVSWSTGPNLSAGCGGLTGVTPLVRYRAWIVETARALDLPLP